MLLEGKASEMTWRITPKSRSRSCCADVEVVVPELPVGIIIQLLRDYLKMKAKQCINLAVLMHPFAFINFQCRVKEV